MKNHGLEELKEEIREEINPYYHKFLEKKPLAKLADEYNMMKKS